MAGLGLVCGAVTACSGPPEPSLIDAYLAPQPPLWRGLPPPSPVPDLARDTRLVGMDPGDLRGVFGEPALVRIEGGVQYWRYSFAGCSLDLFVNSGSDVAAEVVDYDLRLDPVYGNGKAVAECDRLGRQLDQGTQRQAPRRELPPVESF